MKLLKCNIWEYAIIVNKLWEFLILKLAASKKFPKEAWMLPWGRLNIDDQAQQWLQREIIEETWLKVKVIWPCHTARRVSEKKSSKYGIFFLCKTIGKQNVKISNEHIESKRIKFSDIDKIARHNNNSKIAIQKAIILIKSNEII
jgi:8-oxo-dGTP pyrophosphatase MutT (NUDIX family)